MYSFGWRKRRKVLETIQNFSIRFANDIFLPLCSTISILYGYCRFDRHHCVHPSLPLFLLFEISLGTCFTKKSIGIGTFFESYFAPGPFVLDWFFFVPPGLLNSPLPHFIVLALFVSTPFTIQLQLCVCFWHY